MKYSLNHPYLFESSNTAFLISAFQVSATWLVEICNISIIMESFLPSQIVLNFIAVAIIAEFDNFVFEAMRNECCKKLIEFKINEKVLIIHHTTSKRCGNEELSDVKDEDGNFRPLKV